MNAPLSAMLRKVRQSGDYRELCQAIPYARLIGLDCQAVGEELLFRLAPSQDNVGNPVLRVIHGGVLGGFMELAAGLHILLQDPADRLPKVVDFSIDYLRPAQLRDTFARCEVVRQGRTLVNVNVTAWQTRRELSVATARAHFLVAGEERSDADSTA